MMKICSALAQLVTAGVLIAAPGFAVAQQAYPSRPIRFILPFPPGGATTPLARLVGEKLTESWGQPVLVENRAGGNTIIGAEAAAKSPPDGYTILLASFTFVTVPSLLPYLPYDTIRDFDAVATIAKTRYVLVLHPSIPVNSLQELIALAKSKPGQLNYASSGTGTSLHLAAELFNVMAGIKMQHIPYKGSGQLIADLIGGQVHLGFQTPIVAAAHIKSGRLKAIAISSEARSSALPQVPTFAEAGLPSFDLSGWFGIVAPAGTPKEIIDKMSTEIARNLAMPEARERLASQGMEPFISTPEEFASLLKADISRYAGIIKAANIRLER